MTSRPLLTAAIACALLAPGCDGANGSLRVAPAPSGWEQQLAAQRQEKDREFRESPDSPLPRGARATFAGLDYWPVRPAMRFEGPIELDDRIERFQIPATTGALRPCERYGRVHFEIDGRAFTLHVYRLLDAGARPGEDTFFLPFTDATTGIESYPAGRYVDLVGPKGGPYVLDLNRAYNPSCAYGDGQRFACPVTPKENHLAVRVEAGERGFRHAEGSEP